MEFNDEELNRVLFAFSVLDGELGLYEIDKNIIKTIEYQLKVKECAYFKYYPNVEVANCSDEGCKCCVYSE